MLVRSFLSEGCTVRLAKRKKVCGTRFLRCTQISAFVKASCLQIIESLRSLQELRKFHLTGFNANIPVPQTSFLASLCKTRELKKKKAPFLVSTCETSSVGVARVIVEDH